MKTKINKILSVIAVLIILASLVIPVSAIQNKDKEKEKEKEKEYVCMDREKNIASPPPKPGNSEKLDQFIQDHAGIEAQLCMEGKVPKSTKKNIITEDKNGHKVDIDTDKINGNLNHYLKKHNVTSEERNTGILEEQDANDRTENIKNKLKDISPSSYWMGYAYYDWAYSYPYFSGTYTGIFGVLTQHIPYVDPYYGYHSLAELNIEGPGGDIIEAGWRKARGDVTRLFVYWWNNGVPQCYNGCGWVQYSNVYYPGMPLGIDNYGSSYAIQYYYGYWWVWYNDRWIGYYPETLWGSYYWGNIPTFYGEVASAVPSTTTDMGNGIFSSNTYAAKIYNQMFMTSGTWNWAYTYKWASSPYYYSATQPCWACFSGYHDMRYGGPGVN